jgi:3-oxoacyl-[acyl-carrier protein] reductase
MEARKALVTGASSGIGEATAVQLAEEGYSLWLTYGTRMAETYAVAEECRKLGALDVQVSQLDQRDSNSIATLVEAISEGWGSLDVLVNNGGVLPYTTIDDITEEEWDFVLQTNARGTFFLTRACLPLLRQATGDRAIVNLSSLAGQVGGILAPIHYATSKAAILAISKSYARMLAPEGIRVNAVSPGFITTPMTMQLDDTKRGELGTQVPLGSFGEPADVAWIISTLVSPKARFVTGATYDINGGVRME